MRVFTRVPAGKELAMGMAYNKRLSKVKRKRKSGFRARMKTKAGRKIMNAKRRVGRSLNVADK
jgi:large subunit ribosomal protein L34